MLFLIDDALICSNIGDSKCVLFKCTEDDKWSYVNLSDEHKPTKKDEKLRIINSGGVVHPFINGNGEYDDDIQRVWVKDKKYPGLSLSRSIGDEIGKTIGVISQPTFISKKLDNRAKFIILGSDGFWDVMDPKDIIIIVKKYLDSGDPGKAAKALVEKAKKEWDKISERDDITIVLIVIKGFTRKKYQTNLNLKVVEGDKLY